MVARERGVETTPDEDRKFGSSVPDWPAFAHRVLSRKQELRARFSRLRVRARLRPDPTLTRPVPRQLPANGE
jgi:hypothetical protein